MTEFKCNEDDYNECDYFYFEPIFEDGCENIICYCKKTQEACILWNK